MKVQVHVKVGTNAEAGSSLDVVVAESDTASSVKERVSALQLIPFPEQDLMLDGEVLQDGQLLGDCGVKEQASLDLVVRASEDVFARQLSNLLQARDLSQDELGLLYCYKHGVSASQALKTLGLEMKLQEFVKQRKEFLLENNQVSLVRQDTALKPFSVVEEVDRILRASSSGSMDIKDLCARFVQKFGVQLASLAGAKPLEFLAKERDLFVVTGRGHVALKSAPQNQQRPSAEPPQPASELADGHDDAAGEGAESQQYLDLHTKICGRPFNSRVLQALTDVVDVVSQAVFLNIDHVVKGGSVGKCTAISGFADAEVFFFLHGLPPSGHEQWLPPLLRSVAGALAEWLPQCEGIRAAEDCVQLQWRDLVSVELRFSPVFDTYAQAIQALGAQCPEARRFYGAALARERVQFIARQPSPVKITIRLLKWWRDQQEWSGRLVRPNDEILELMVIYSAVQTKPADQRKAIANVMSLLSRFDEVRIVWSNYYAKGDVWAPLLRQRPLLMDPVNPFVNIADPQTFDARELMEAARRTHFFW